MYVIYFIERKASFDFYLFLFKMIEIKWALNFPRAIVDMIIFVVAYVRFFHMFLEERGQGKIKWACIVTDYITTPKTILLLPKVPLIVKV